ncbi:PqqD family protein [Sulfuracidifex tepidarius]|uniref:Coenzyme PQQ synthesis protein D n=1 Tax=Sulfuracidifex tepidarius TaxID=1294262 RepID=A0A510DYU6_9CREN|nr:PqqD family protein [Sulfuracidifex tepidarius]BBG25412.1 Coenzyme PQQ synthesis protein D [Sulfuracidifex tepidarius]BBG28206.1 Coenzyme PQQ synthesis protein D [Sulfuracidifex tepidarius]
MDFNEMKERKPSKKGEFLDMAEDGQNFIIKLSDDKVFEVHPVAYYVWSLCDGNTSVETIVDKIEEEIKKEPEGSQSEITKDQLIEPVVTILNELEKASLIMF